MNVRLLTGRMSPAGLRCLAAFVSIIFGSVSVGADVVVELADGTSPAGRITSLTDTILDLVVDGSPRSIAIRDIRTIQWKPASGSKEADDSASTHDSASTRLRPVRIVLVDGSVLEGDDLAVSDKAVSVFQDGRALPIARESIATAEFRNSTADGGVGAGGNPPAWLASLKEAGRERAAGSDVVVVGSAEKPEFVECAILAVTPDAVSVLLDDETIRVKRSKVIGLKWLRSDEVGQADGVEARAVVVEVDGGRLLTSKVTIDGDEVAILLDGGEPIRVPSAAMRRIDFASGRTVSLVSLEPERVEVEPWFGVFTAIEGLVGHFSPQKVTVSDGAFGGQIAKSGMTARGAREGLRLRPRTVIAWRLPGDARGVAMRLTESSSLVTISIDGREVYRGQPSTPVPVVADATGGRLLKVTVDFPPSGPGTGGPSAPGVVLVEPRIER